MADSSFDIVSKVDRQEVDNALNQAAKELATRFDFRGTDTKIEWKGDEAIELTSSTEERVKAAVDVFKEKLIRDDGPKNVKTQIQGDEIRVTSKKRDDLQAVIAMLKQADLDVALQFVNYR